MARNVHRVADLEHAARRDFSAAERLGKALTDVAGSAGFLLAHVALFGGWIIWNTAAAPSARFDPYPFGLMTVFVSLESMFLAMFVLITQNRMLKHSERRDHLTLQVDMLTEQELTVALRLLRQVADRVGVPAEDDDQRHAESLMEDTDVQDVMSEIDQALHEPKARP